MHAEAFLFNSASALVLRIGTNGHRA